MKEIMDGWSPALKRIGRGSVLLLLLMLALGTVALIVWAVVALVNLLISSIPHLFALSWGPEPVWVWLIDVALVPVTLLLVGLARRALAVPLIPFGVACLLALLISWMPEWHWLPVLFRQQAMDLRHYTSQLPALQWLTHDWDWERLRIVATLWVVVEGLGLWSVEKVSVPVVTALPAFGLIGLAFLQYAAVGGGQPAWAMEHIVIHLIQLVDPQSADTDALRRFFHEHFAGRSYHDPSLQAQIFLFAVALTLSFAIRWVESLPDRLCALLVGT